MSMTSRSDLEGSLQRENEAQFDCPKQESIMTARHGWAFTEFQGNIIKHKS